MNNQNYSKEEQWLKGACSLYLQKGWENIPQRSSKNTECSKRKYITQGEGYKLENNKTSQKFFPPTPNKLGIESD